MRKQNYTSALVLLSMSLGCLIVGYWIGYDERREMAERIVVSHETELLNVKADTRESLWMLLALQNGKTKDIVDFLTMKVKSGLKPIQPIGHEAIDQFANISRPSEKMIRDAIEYQEKYCNDDCLGM